MNTFIRVLLLGLVMASAAAFAESRWQAKIACERFASRVSCYFQPLSPVRIVQVQLGVGDAAVEPVSHWRRFKQKFDAAAVLWLVDVGESVRTSTLAAQQVLLKQWLADLIRRQKVGLAAFLDVIDVLAPVGSDVASIRAAIDDLGRHKQPVALYGSIASAIRQLEEIKAERKSLWVFTSGVVRDTMYRHDKVVSLARAAGVSIIVLVYPAAGGRNVDLLPLQRLAAQTGGYFALADARGELPAQTYGNILALVEGGGDFSLIFPDTHDPRQVTVRLLDDIGGSYQETLLLRKAAPVAVEPDARRKSPAALIWGVFALGAMALLMACWRVIRWRRSPVGGRDRALLLQPVDDETGAPPWPIPAVDRCRIGRARDNDLCLSNNSVSSHHAELRRRTDGSLVIHDLDSTNGVWVNGKRIRRRVLRDGDLLALGEVSLRVRCVGERAGSFSA